ncbi:hypothetical protein VTK56DRAFT_8701 [Thermocarpiscus australiensis]
MGDGPTRKEAKGKAKEDAESSREGILGDGVAERKDDGSLLPRIAQSAASLPSFLLSGPPNAGTGGNEKGQSSRAGDALARADASSVQLQSNIPRGETMRMGQAQEHIAQEEASFSAFLDSGSSPMLTEPGGLEGAWQSTSVATTGMSSAPGTAELPCQSVAEQEANDGADVVALLSTRSGLGGAFDVEQPASQGDLSGLRKVLFGEEADHGISPISWDNVLNFIPDYLQAAPEPRFGSEDELSMHLGTADAGEAWQTWIDQWSRVLTSYQDDVWGDLSALVEEARAEVRRIEEAKPGEKPPEPTALLRLRAILGHLRGPS